MMFVAALVNFVSVGVNFVSAIVNLELRDKNSDIILLGYKILEDDRTSF